jgi:UDP-N-acetylmuramoylalanine--D-glutamate ligase
MQHLKNKKILILGLGISGLSMARWCVRCGASVTVQDTRANPPSLRALQEELPGIYFLHAPFDANVLHGSEIQAVFVSPGIAPISYANLQNEAQNQGLLFGNELTLFIRALDILRTDNGYVPKIVAVTGTNGKTTVVSLTNQLAQRSGKSTRLAGNIGPALLDALSQAIDTNTLPQLWILELSSFQLSLAHHFKPTVATILNITQDHLDWHDDMDNYAHAKANIFGSDSVMLLNRDDVRVWSHRPQHIKGENKRTCLSFGSDVPQNTGDFGLEEAAGIVWLVRAYSDAEPPIKKRSAGYMAEIFIQRLMPIEALRIHGRHNACNALAALALCSSVGCDLADLLHGLGEYLGEPHRTQSIGILHEVEFFDDSKGTNVGATIAALKGLGATRQLLLILGGDGKGQDFSLLRDPISQFVKAVFLIGKDAENIRLVLNDTNVPCVFCTDMREAVNQAYVASSAGDAVLLSPSCASWDMYKNYEHRAQAFTQATYELAAEFGIDLETTV